MSLVDLLLAVVVAGIWGLNFVVMKIGVDLMPPLLMSALRYFPILMVLLLFRPPVPTSWKYIVCIGFSLGTIAFTLLYVGINFGMPAGLASLVLQSQAILTVLLASLVGDTPSKRKVIGVVVATMGLMLTTHDMKSLTTLVGFVFVIGAALFWAVSNILIKLSKSTDSLALMMWVSLIPPFPLLVLSYLMEGPDAIIQAFYMFDIQMAGILLYLGFGSTILAYSLWAHLLKRYSANVVAPFTLLVPFFGMGGSSIFLDEKISTLDLFSFVIVLCGLSMVLINERAISVLSWHRSAFEMAYALIGKRKNK